MRYYKKTSIVKKVFTGILASAAGLGILTGMHLIGESNYDKAKDNKAKIISEFQLTEEYKKAKSEQTKEIQEAFIKGKITYDVKEEKMDSLNSQAVTENLIVKYGNEEFNERLKEVNMGILKTGKEAIKGFLFCVSSSVLAIAFTYKFVGMMGDFKYDELENDEELSQRPVIV